MKKKLVVLGALAISAAAAVPALAIENEFHGMYRLRAMMTNFEDAGLSGTQAKGAAPSATNLLSTDNRSYTLFEQRARLQYIAKANDDLKLVTHFEVDSTWGDASYQNGRGMGGGVAADTVNLETKNIYLDFNAGKVNMKVGIQGFMDAYKGIFLQDDVAGAVASTKFGAATATAGFLRTYDAGGTTALGKKNVDLYILDGKFAASKALTVGASYYLANNDVNFSGQQTHNIGVNVAAKAGAMDLDAFLLYQTGSELYGATGKDLNAYAGQVAVKANMGAAALRVAGLYASGDDGKKANKSTAFQNIFAPGVNPAVAGSTNGAPGGSLTAPSTSSGVYYSSQMLLLFRNIYNMDSDTALVTSINNGNRGVVAAFLGADVKMNDKLSLSANAGHAMVEKRLYSSPNMNKNVGTEVNVNLNYALYSNLTATVQGAYVFLGGYPKDGNAKEIQNPYLAGLMMNYTF